MPRLRVRDVMTTEVVTARDDTSYAEIAAVLAGKRISAVSIVDRFDVVVGVVSWTDLHSKIRIGDPDATARARRWRRWAAPLLRWPAGSAVEVMNAPPVTVGPDVSLAAAARMMYRKDVGRLLVVDDIGRLRGVVSRSDLLKLHGRLDAVIRDEVMQRVPHRTLMIEPGTVEATVDDGVVTLAGRTRTQDDGARSRTADRGRRGSMKPCRSSGSADLLTGEERRAWPVTRMQKSGSPTQTMSVKERGRPC